MGRSHFPGVPACLWAKCLPAGLPGKAQHCQAAALSPSLGLRPRVLSHPPIFPTQTGEVWPLLALFSSAFWCLVIAGFPDGAAPGKNLPASARDSGLIPESGRSPGEGNGTHPSILAWDVPWTEEPGGLQFMGPQRARRNLATEQAHRHFVIARPFKSAKVTRTPFLQAAASYMPHDMDKKEKKVDSGTSLVVQWLSLHTSTTGGSSPGWGTKFPHATQRGQKKEKPLSVFL